MFMIRKGLKHMRKTICVGTTCYLKKTVGILLENERVTVVSLKDGKHQVKVRNACGIERMVYTKYLKISPN